MAHTAAAMWGATGARSARRRRRCAPVLPDELVVWEILVHLPAKALLRCRAVCRSWRRLTSAADFVLAHHRLQPSLPLVFLHGKIRDSRGGASVGATLDAFDLWPTPCIASYERRRPTLRFKDYKDYREFKVHASCDGLLLFSLCNLSRFYICNPATRQWMPLPRLPLPTRLVGNNVAGLYRHSSSGEYRVLYRKRSYWGGVNAAYYVLTVGSDAEPRCIGEPSDSASINQYMVAGLRSVNECPPVMLHGCLHWIFNNSEAEPLIVFDTVAETFRTMSPPTDENSPWGSWRHLLEMDDGTLGVSCIDERNVSVKLWVLKDYESEVWSLKYQIELWKVELRSIDKKCSGSKVRIVSGKGDVLVFCSNLCHLFHCDSTGELLQNFRRHRVFSRPIGHWFKESLVRHAFFQGQDGDRAVQPLFFQGS